jgi:fructoselysine-6-P-deglycase FrlB-like protein
MQKGGPFRADDTMSKGIDQLRHEMARQHRDALASLRGARDRAGPMAEALRARGRLALLGMGGSHWINRAAGDFYRAAGLDATEHVVSEYMRAPLPGDPAMLVTSQSGRSGEVLRLIEQGLVSPVAYGLTLEGDSPLATALPSLVGAGGREAAYAATRSQTITLALHAALLEALGADISEAEAVLEAGPQPLPAAAGPAIAALARAPVAVMVARGGAAQGVMDAAALCLMEIARLPVLGLEAGQFRHGPFEMIESDSAVMMLRGAGPDSDDIGPLAAECVAHGIAPIIVDASGRAPVAGAITVQLGPQEGLALAFAALPVIQDMLVSAAARRRPDAGLPRRSSKVASAEVA